MSLLFDTPLIDGLHYEDEVIAKADEQALIDRLAAAGLEPFRFHGWLGNRKTRTFGWRYDFQDSSFAPADPLPAWLAPLRQRAARLAGTQPEDFVHVLLARYDPGAGIGWHRDRDVFDRVVGFSLGTPATLRFRRRRPAGGFDRTKVEVQPRSAYLLSGPVRYEWEHSISPGDQLRFSITFRTLSENGQRIAAEQQERTAR